MTFEEPRLHGRRVGAQEPSAIQPERVLHVARWMVGRDVQGVEVVVFGLDLGTVQHCEAERYKELLQFLLDACDRVQVATARSRRGKGEVDPFGFQPRAQGCLGERRLAGFERIFQLLAGAVHYHADALAVVGRELAHVLTELRKATLASERVHARGLQLLRRRGGADTGQRTGLELLYGFF